ncbi:MBL fold metallo-hydrolase [Kiloniella antarctica]|uniref:MBL fold metallo-hydrolase n=1 Tax=Kiloniella antarctica TaxID=1550907 RepID=A0ABW5BKG0_9PROT
MIQPICATCGTQYPEATIPPVCCPICEDERQYVPATGQAWTTVENIEQSHHIVRTEISSTLHALTIEPKFAIGQRGFLIKTPFGNVLWDCLAMVDDTTIDWIKGNGELSAIAISHPHYYTAMGAWSDAFDNIPIYLHTDDAKWVQKPHSSIRHWSGETEILNLDLTLIRCGGHFKGGTVLHWKQDKGTLFTGDIMQVVADLQHVSFMRSYPNYIPLPATAVRRIGKSVEGFEFETIHGAFPGLTIARDGNKAVEKSVSRYLLAIDAPKK